MSKLDEKGRCCGIKPIDYKGGSYRSPQKPQKFCFRCYRAFDRVTGEQIENWKWNHVDGEWVNRPLRRPL